MESDESPRLQADLNPKPSGTGLVGLEHVGKRVCDSVSHLYGALIGSQRQESMGEPG